MAKPNTKQNVFNHLLDDYMNALVFAHKKPKLDALDKSFIDTYANEYAAASTTIFAIIDHKDIDNRVGHLVPTETIIAVFDTEKAADAYVTQHGHPDCKDGSLSIKPLTLNQAPAAHK